MGSGGTSTFGNCGAGGVGGAVTGGGAGGAGVSAAGAGDGTGCVAVAGGAIPLSGTKRQHARFVARDAQGLAGIAWVRPEGLDQLAPLRRGHQGQKRYSASSSPRHSPRRACTCAAGGR